MSADGAAADDLAVKHDPDRPSTDSDIQLEGIAVGDAGNTFAVTLRASTSGRTVGALTLVVQSGGFGLTGEHLSWAAVTRRGWAHLRGTGRLQDGSTVPFRCDVFSAVAIDGTGPDQISLRVYPSGSDPDRDSPASKLAGSMPNGTVRLGKSAGS